MHDFNNGFRVEYRIYIRPTKLEWYYNPLKSTYNPNRLCQRTSRAYDPMTGSIRILKLEKFFM